MPHVRGRLPRLATDHRHVRGDRAERIDDDLALDRLERVDDDGHRALVELLERLLCVDVHAREPAAKAGMRVVPAHNHFRAPRLGQHVEHVGLEDVVDGLDGDASARLRHGKDIDDADCVVVDKAPQHEAHDLHRHTRAGVLEHFEKRQRRDVHHLCRVDDGRVRRRCTHASETFEAACTEKRLKVVHSG
eukprot:Amastigsp_a508550_293.p2 type:complete len:190 gc:universal Amastigsp_a508550_293:602-33(-)